MKQYSIYKHHVKHKPEIWHLHRSYSSMESAIDSLRDLTKRSRKKRIWSYSLFPAIDGTGRVFEADEKLTKMLQEVSK